MTRFLLEVTDLDTRETRWHAFEPTAEPELVAAYALRYAQQFANQPTEAVPMRLAMFPGGDEETDDAA